MGQVAAQHYNPVRGVAVSLLGERHLAFVKNNRTA